MASLGLVEQSSYVAAQILLGTILALH